jgi:phosphoribosyl 1,2-cyclic phosphate phosphodiesterase
MVACDCPVCRSTDPRDNRTRSSIYVKSPEIVFLVDTSPDLRAQVIRENIMRVEAVVYTHEHADHIFGFDDLRRFCDENGGVMPVYAPSDTLQRLQMTFDYAFDPKLKIRGYVHAEPHVIDGPFQLGGWTLTPLPVPHGRFTTNGYLFEREGRKRLVYLSDCKSVPDAVKSLIRDVPLLIIDGLRDAPHPTHLTVAEAIEVAREVGAGQTYLTHLTHEKSHAQRLAELPEGITLAYDGLRLRV